MDPAPVSSTPTLSGPYRAINRNIFRNRGNLSWQAMAHAPLPPPRQSGIVFVIIIGMKALIVDDEKLTRTGLRTAVDWRSLGVEEIAEAANGEEGISLARQLHPDIILTDVRMPRMDGIAMVERILAFLPEVSVIFMSGYSDKEYLKAAIRFGAVSYVEKPLDPAEIAEAIRQAAAKLAQADLARHGQTLQEKEQEEQLARLLTRPAASLPGEDAVLPAAVHKDDAFVSLIVEYPEGSPAAFAAALEQAIAHLNAFLPSLHLHEIHTVKDGRYLCFFLCGPRRSRAEYRQAAASLREALQGTGLFFTVLGETALSIRSAYASYSSAVVLLQQAFFLDDCPVLCPEDIPDVYPPIVRDLSQEFFEALTTRNREKAFSCLAKQKDQFRPPCLLLPAQARDLYYRCFQQLQRAFQLAHLSPGDSSSPWEVVENAPTLGRLHSSLEEACADYFERLRSPSQENGLVFEIQDFIHSNYPNEALSVKTISEHLHRSAPDIYPLFKAETGKTLNQYITEYRMERARDLLLDPAVRITDVAAKVGYSDVNYFGKLFKKVQGVTPTEYRTGTPAGS